jgi:hypothetical protein
MPFFRNVFKKLLTTTNGGYIIKTTEGFISTNSCKEGDMF